MRKEKKEEEERIEVTTKNKFTSKGKEFIKDDKEFLFFFPRNRFKVYSTF